MIIFSNGIERYDDAVMLYVEALMVYTCSNGSLDVEQGQLKILCWGLWYKKIVRMFLCVFFFIASQREYTYSIMRYSRYYTNINCG